MPTQPLGKAATGQGNKELIGRVQGMSAKEVVQLTKESTAWEKRSLLHQWQLMSSCGLEWEVAGHLEPEEGRLVFVREHPVEEQMTEAEEEEEERKNTPKSISNLKTHSSDQRQDTIRMNTQDSNTEDQGRIELPELWEACEDLREVRS